MANSGTIYTLNIINASILGIGGSGGTAGGTSPVPGAGGNGYGLYNNGSIGSLSIAGGLISGVGGTGGFGDANGTGYGIYNDLLIDNLTLTDGTISGGGAGSGIGFHNTTLGSVGSLSNMGVIIGTTFGIDNAGSIGTLLNGQGGNGSVPSQTALSYTGHLPGTYLEYVSSNLHYGQLNYTGSDTLSNFGIANGSSLANGTYASVLTGITTVETVSSSLGTISGSIDGGTWVLEDMGGNVWDLILSGLVGGPNAINTLLELGYTRDQVLSALRNRAALTNNALDYDCLTFDKSGVCVSVNLRYSNESDQTETAGVVIGAVRLSPNARIGAFFDYAGRQNSIGGIAYGNEMPMFGGFLGFTEKPDGTGVQGRLAAAYHTGKATITRGNTLSNTEAGSGTADLTAWGLSGELGYGFAVATSMRATPFVGLRYGDAERSGYTEETSDSASYPITYDAYYQHMTTGTAGVRFSGMFNDKLSYQFGGGLEYDLQSDANAFSGTSAIADLPTFALDNTADARRLRVNGSFGVGLAMAPSTKLTASVSVRQEAYTNTPNTNVLIGFQSGF